eukprot:5526976-Amphidinium_carterae.1
MSGLPMPDIRGAYCSVKRGGKDAFKQQCDHIGEMGFPVELSRTWTCTFVRLSYSMHVALYLNCEFLSCAMAYWRKGS